MVLMAQSKAYGKARKGVEGARGSVVANHSQNGNACIRTLPG